MKYENKIKLNTVSNGGIGFNILESGDVATIQKKDVQINLLRGNNLEGSCSNLFLRILENNEIFYTKMIGVDSPGKYYIENNQVFYKGVFKNVSYKVTLSVLDNIWFWDVELNNIGVEDVKVDVIYGQDVAIANGGSVRNNEAYVCQYLDHKVFNHELGYTVCTRQNQGKPHFLQIGSLTKNIAYSTDGFQFFGLDYKVTNEPVSLKKDTLANSNYQYEFAYIALQSERIDLSSTVNMTFYGLYNDEIYEVSTSPRFLDEITMAHRNLSIGKYQGTGISISRKIYFSNILDSLPLTNEEIDELYPHKRHAEKENDTLLSFFSDNSSHVVLKAKEVLVERPHGQMLVTGNNLIMKETFISSTNYMFGVFNSHIVVGNTNFNKFLTNNRNPLNIQKISGQRMFVEINGEYKLLGVPSLFEVGVNYAKWIYKLPEDTIIITSMVLVDSPQIILDVKSEKGLKYNFLLTNHIVLGPNEFEHPFIVRTHNNVLEFTPNPKAMCSQKYPNLTYRMIMSQNFKIYNDAVFYNDNICRNEPLVNLELKETDSFRMIIQGCIDGKEIKVAEYDLEAEKARYLHYIKRTINNFKLTIDNEYQDEVDKFNDIAVWYTHNALIHYASPHGLEQYNGAAWGTRDVCQGPVELFLSTQKYQAVRDILLKVYSHQFIHNGDFPQWFMFDKYYQIQAHDSHGDIIVWPLRILAMYILTTSDLSILEEKVSYTDLQKNDFTKERYSILDHVFKQIKAIKDNFIPGTYLSCYGGGDWDDTLQPANKTLTKSMVSGWTVALTYEAMNLFSRAVKTYDKIIAQEIEELAENIKKDYHTLLVKDDIPSGFILFTNDSLKYMLHPLDNETGLKYRLLPFNRGIISELLDKDKIDNYLEIIDKQLKHPDGVRLMDKPVQYKGGINTYFTRAETSANFGREIGLLYVHAHIRYVELLAKLGKSDDVWNNLLKVNPINIHEVVPNALKRQSNLYFSSSDANFSDRYEAVKDFDKVRTGKIGVKGGWRVYSSGPGIYLNQLISNCLGVRVLNNDLVLDPVLPNKLDGLKFNYQFDGKDLEITYHIKTNQINKVIVNKKEISLEYLNNKYRVGGVIINKDLLNQNSNKIEVYL